MEILDEIYKQLKQEDRKKEYFYVTDLGVCPRKVVMDFGDYKKKPLTNAERLMFHKAESDHREMAMLLNKSNRYSVMKYEMNITEGLPDMWHGRLDCLVYDLQLNEMFPVDWKGTRSLKYRVELPKANHVLQVKCYIWALYQMNYPVTKGKLIYTDRTGSYDGMEYWVSDCNAVEIQNLMNVYQVALNSYMYDKELPDILPRTINKTKDEYYLVPDWQCGYCKYQGLSCEPNMSKNKIAEIKDNKLVMRKGYEEYEKQISDNKVEEDDFIKFCDTGV